MTRRKPPPALEPRVLDFIREHRLIPGQHYLLVAVSGGADSTCLLHVLATLKDELGVRLQVAHLDHQLRGAESAADATYVAELAQRLGIPATIEKRDVRAYQAEKRISPEEAAREVRYSFLAQVAQSIGAYQVAVGHTLDDQVETILMHLIRGTGTRGLRGLQPYSQRQLAGSSLAIIRPLLEVSRQETATYCQHHRLMPRLDTSNQSLSPLRNRIRHQLLPLLQNYNPQVAKALLRTARLANDDLAFLESEAGRLGNEITEKHGDTMAIDKAGFCQLHPALKRHLLRLSIEELLGNIKDIETRHIEEIMAVLDKPAGKQISLPGGLIFSIEYDKYLLGADPAALSPFPVMEGEFALKIPGETRLPGWQVEATVVNREPMTEKDKGFTTESLTEGSLTDPSTVAGKLTGAEPGQNTIPCLPDAVMGKPEGDNAPSEIIIPLPIAKGKGMGLINSDFTACFDLEKAGDKLAVRSRQPGDRFQPMGMSQPKKLNKFMIDTKIPRAWRQRVPIVCSPEHILWVVGWRLDDRVKVTDNTKQILRLEFKRG